MNRTITSALIVVFCWAFTFAGPYDQQWRYSMKIYLNTTASGANVAADVSNFPVLVRLNPSLFSGFANTNTGGSDVRFANPDGSALPYQIERWLDISGNADIAEIWVKVPVVKGGNQDQYIKMYWGNTSAQGQSSATSVFETTNNFAGVWHLSEDASGTGTTGLYQNASGRENGDDYVSSTNKKGLIGRGQKFDGTDDYIKLTQANNFDINTAFTMEAWVKPTFGSWPWWAHLWGDWTGAVAEEFAIREGKIYIQIREKYSTGPDCDNVWGPSQLTLNQWNHVVATFNAGTIKVYLNGNLDATKSTNVNDVHNTGNNKFIGAKNNVVDFPYSGYIDEFRLSLNARSQDWIKLEFQNQQQNQTLITFGPVVSREQYENWSYFTRVYINTSATGANISQNVDNFPLLIRLDPSNFPYFSKTLIGGADIRFAASDGSPLPYEIDQWDDGAYNNDQAAIWVRVPLVYGNNSSQYILMYWGKWDAVSRSDPSAVFENSNSFAGVWHLNEEMAGTGTPGVYRDASGNGNSGQDFISSTVRNGIIGKGRYLNGNGDYIKIPASSQLNMASKNVTISAWVRSSADYPNEERMLIEHDVWANAGAYQLTTMGSDNLRWNYVGANAAQDYNHDFTDGNWHYVVSVFNDAANSQAIYYDGIQQSSGSSTPSIGSSAAATYIGCRGGYTMFFQGDIDEIQIASTNRADAWIKLCYANQRSDQNLVAIGQSQPQENLAQWTYSKKLYLNTSYTGADVELDVADFPVFIRLQEVVPDFNYSQAKANADDIRFADETGKCLPYQIERWDAANHLAEIWVKKDVLRGNSSSQYITMYWGNPNASIASQPSTVFGTNSGFVGVWHLNDDPADNPNSPSCTDATSNNINGFTHGSMTANDAVDGICGKGFHFDGVNDYVDFGTPTESDMTGTTDVSVSAWVKVNPGETWKSIIGKGDFQYHLQVPTGDDAEFCVHDDANWRNAIQYAQTQSGVWYYLTGVYDSKAQKVKLYKNSQLVAEYNGAVSHISAAHDDFLWMGRNASISDGRYMNGVLDEVRISNTAASPSWIKLCYENQKPGQTLVQTNIKSEEIVYTDGEIVQEYNTIGQMTRATIDFDGDGRMEKDKNGGSWDVHYRFYVKDHLGSTRVVLNGDAPQSTPVQSMAYDPYGKLIFLASQAAEHTTREQFTGKELDMDGAANSIDFNVQIGNIQDPYLERNAYITLYYADGTSETIPMEASGDGTSVWLNAALGFKDGRTLAQIRFTCYSTDHPIFDHWYECPDRDISGNSHYKITLLNPDNQANGIPINTTPVATSNFISIAEDASPVAFGGMGKEYFGRRYYDPEIARWTSVDPADQFWNPYMYCSADPISHTDPDGSLDPIMHYIVGGASEAMPDWYSANPNVKAGSLAERRKILAIEAHGKSKVSFDEVNKYFEGKNRKDYGFTQEQWEGLKQHFRDDALHEAPTASQYYFSPLEAIIFNADTWPGGNGASSALSYYQDNLAAPIAILTGVTMPDYIFSATVHLAQNAVYDLQHEAFFPLIGKALVNETKTTTIEFAIMPVVALDPTGISQTIFTVKSIVDHIRHWFLQGD